MWETGSCYSLRLTLNSLLRLAAVLLPQLAERWDHRCALPRRPILTLPLPAGERGSLTKPLCDIAAPRAGDLQGDEACFVSPGFNRASGLPNRLLRGSSFCFGIPASKRGRKDGS